MGYGQRGLRGATCLQAVDDSCLLDHNALPVRTPFASRTAGDAVRTLANDVLPGGLDLSGVQDVSPVNQFVIVPQKTWTEHVQELATMARATLSRARRQAVVSRRLASRASPSASRTQSSFPTALTLLQPDQLRNDVTIIGELEPVVYVRDYFLGDGTTLAFYLSEKFHSAKLRHGLPGGLHCATSWNPRCGASPIPITQALGQRRSTAHQRRAGDGQLRRAVGAGGRR